MGTLCMPTYPEVKMKVAVVLLCLVVSVMAVATAREGSSMPSQTRLLFLPLVRQLVGNRRVRLAVMPPHGSILQKPPLPSSLYYIALSADTCRLKWPGCQYNFVIGTCFVLHKLKLNKKNIR